MDRTLSLRLSNTPARPDVARHLVMALAVGTGMRPLSADRAGAAVARALAACSAPRVEIDAVLKVRSVVLTICAGDAGWSRTAAAALAHLDAAVSDGCVTLGLERTPLTSV
jgi:hypothetical protein